MRTITVRAEDAGRRLDQVVAEHLHTPRNQVAKWLQDGLISLDDGHARASQKLVAGQHITVKDVVLDTTIASIPKLTILYEDDDMLVVDKPAGLAVHLSESGRPQPTVAGFAAQQGVQDDDADRPGIVHRLDKDTSGALVVAKHSAAKKFLQQQFAKRLVEKSYVVLVVGRLKDDEAVIDLPIARSKKTPTKRAVVPGGRKSVTKYRVVAEYGGYSLVDVDLQTGRTHQIRVHFQHIGHPVAGDTTYGGAVPGLKRQFLHAEHIKLTGPSGRAVDVHSPLAPDLQDFLNALKGTV